MNPPARSIGTELNDALVGGIRERGSEAVGLVLIGAARLFLAFLAVLLSQILGVAIFGFDLVSLPSAALSVISVALSVVATTGLRWSGNPDPEAGSDSSR
jgi:hypothetical protein